MLEEREISPINNSITALDSDALITVRDWKAADFLMKLVLLTHKPEKLN